MFCVILEVVEDEFHVLFHCPVRRDLRNHLFEKNPDLFRTSEAESLMWLLKEEIFGRVMEDGTYDRE